MEYFIQLHAKGSILLNHHFGVSEILENGFIFGDPKDPPKLPAVKVHPTT